MTKVKKVKKVKKFGIGKFIVMALILGGGLIYGTQMVQKNQENRSNAAAPKTACKCSNPKYGNVSSCVKGKGKWVCPLAATPTSKPTAATKKCSPTKCGDCTTASACSSANCYWETQVKTCTSRLEVDISKGSCVYGGVTILDGIVNCIDKGLLGSRLVKCTKGKISTLKTYADSKNCDKNSLNTCVYRSTMYIMDSCITINGVGYMCRQNGEFENVGSCNN